MNVYEILYPSVGQSGPNILQSLAKYNGKYPNFSRSNKSRDRHKEYNLEK